MHSRAACQYQQQAINSSQYHCFIIIIITIIIVIIVVVVIVTIMVITVFTIFLGNQIT